MVRRLGFWVGIVSALGVAVLLIPSAAGSAVDGTNINPGQRYDGLVNGQSDGAVITLNCEQSFEGSGRARDGNTASVSREPAGEGFTGNNGTGVRARFFDSAGNFLQQVYFDKFTTRSIAGYVFPGNEPGTVEFLPYDFRNKRRATGGTSDFDGVTYACAAS